MTFFGEQTSEQTIGSGTFDCPYCHSPEPFRRVATHRTYCIFFLPIIPQGRQPDQIECQSCFSRVSADVVGQDGRTQFAPETAAPIDPTMAAREETWDDPGDGHPFDFQETSGSAAETAGTYSQGGPARGVDGTDATDDSNPFTLSQPQAGGPQGPTYSSAAPASPYAVTSLVLAAVSPFLLLACGLSIFTSLIAIVTGHVALSQIRNSRGTITGDWQAWSGLIVGYVFLGLSVLFIGALIAPALMSDSWSTRSPSRRAARPTTIPTPSFPRTPRPSSIPAPKIPQPKFPPTKFPASSAPSRGDASAEDPMRGARQAQKELEEMVESLRSNQMRRFGSNPSDPANRTIPDPAEDRSTIPDLSSGLSTRPPPFPEPPLPRMGPSRSPLAGPLSRGPRFNPAIPPSMRPGGNPFAPDRGATQQGQDAEESVPFQGTVVEAAPSSLPEGRAANAGPSVRSPSRSNASPRKPAPEKIVGEVQNFPDMGWAVKSLAFSPSNDYLAAGKMDETLLSFDLQDGQTLTQLPRIRELGSVDHIGFSADGKTVLAAGQKGVVAAWAFNDEGKIGEMVNLVGHTRPIDAMAISPVSDFLVTAAGGELIWQTFGAAQSTSRNLKVSDHKIIALHLPARGAVALATDGREVFACDLKTATIQGRKPLKGSYAHSASFSRQGDRLAISRGREIEVVDIASGQIRQTLQADRDIQWSVAFHPDGDQLVSGGRGKVTLWETSTGSVKRQIEWGTIQYIQTLSISGDGSMLAAIASSAGQTLRVVRWDADESP